MGKSFKARFEIEDLITYKDGVLLTGRCISNSIKIGDEFHRAIKRTVVRGEGRNFTVEKSLLGSVNLEVVEIQYFRTMVNELFYQQSGAIYVRGEKIDLVAQGCEIET